MTALKHSTPPPFEPCYGSFSITHVGSARRINRDAVVERSDIGLWAVADAMGGDNTPGVGSATIARALSRLAAFDSQYAGRRLVRSALTEVNAQLFQRAKEERLGNVGASVVILLIQDGMYACLWAGNSRAYLFRDGAIRQISQDHCLDESRTGQPDYKPVLIRSIGSRDALEIDAVGGELRQGDRFLLCSDGANVVGEPELEQLAAADNTQAALNACIENALETGAPDNVSFVAVRL